MAEAFEECIADAGIERSQIDAAWLSTAFDSVNVGPSALPLATSLRLGYIPVTHVENMCASGTEAFRGACYAVASGAADFALALGVEKLKDTGYGGLPARTRGVTNDSVLAQRLRAGRLRTARGRLSRRPRHRPGRSQARDGSRLGQEPRQWRAQSQGALAPRDHPREGDRGHRWLRSPSASSIAAASATARPAPSSPRPRSP